MSQNKPFPLTARVPIGRDAQGKLVYPTEDFMRLWDGFFKRVGEYKALSNPELEALIGEGQAEPFAAQFSGIEAQIHALLDDLSPATVHIPQEQESAEARIAQLEAQLFKLAREVEDLKQGTIL